MCLCVVVLSLMACIVVCCFCSLFVCFFLFKQKTAYEMRISDWSSDVCSSDLSTGRRVPALLQPARGGMQISLPIISRRCPRGSGRCCCGRSSKVSAKRHWSTAWHRVCRDKPSVGSCHGRLVGSTSKYD